MSDVHALFYTGREISLLTWVDALVIGGKLLLRTNRSRGRTASLAMLRCEHAAITLPEQSARRAGLSSRRCALMDYSVAGTANFTTSYTPAGTCILSGTSKATDTFSRSSGAGLEWTSGYYAAMNPLIGCVAGFGSCASNITLPGASGHATAAHATAAAPLLPPQTCARCTVVYSILSLISMHAGYLTHFCTALHCISLLYSW